MSAGCSYFGVRIARHVRRDMADLAARGYTSVLHTYSENDLAYYRGTIREIVEASHAEGLTVQLGPWGLGRTFGGEAESRFVAFHPEACQVMDDGRRVAAACLNQPAYRAFCKEWADAALEAGADSVFWDEPAWVMPVHVGVDDPARWSCRCDVCADRFGGPLPTELTPEAQAFREASVVDFLRDVVAHVAGRGGRNTICLLPATGGTHGISDWDTVASLPGLTTFATDPYWKHWGEPAGPFVRRFARLLRETCDRHGVGAQLWLPSFGLTRDEIPELEAAIEGAREEGVTDLWTWGYEACGHMTSLATPDAPLVWEAVSAALTRPSAAADRGGLAAVRRPRAPLCARARPPDERGRRHRAARGRRGGRRARGCDRGDRRAARRRRPPDLRRRRHVGTPRGARRRRMRADVRLPSRRGGRGHAVGRRGGRGRHRGGAADLAALGPGPGDAVVAVTASGSTPYVLAALDAAKAAGALRVAVVCVRGSAAGARADHEVVVVVGPEAIAGSTRLKAGTAQKLVLNTISTVTMVRLGRTYGGLMVSVVQDNAKLRERARRNVVLATGAPEEEVDAALEESGGDAKVALVSLLAGVDPSTARERLAGAGGSVRLAVGDRR